MTVYVVEGNTGEYEDRFDWIVKAFTSKDRAEDLARELNILVKNSGRDMSYEDRDNLQNMIRENLDPNCYVEYTGTYYSIKEIEVE